MDQSADPTKIFDHSSPYDTSLQRLEVEFTLPKSGWIWGRVKPLHELYALSCSHICDPFERMILWLEQIASGAEAATWSIDHEGHSSRLQFYGGHGRFDDRCDYLLHIETDGMIDRVRGVEVKRHQLVESFYRAFRTMADDPAYTPREWDHRRATLGSTI